MKTTIFNKKEHLEGFVGKDGSDSEKSDVQKQYEAGNDGNAVTSYGKDSILKKNSTTISGNTKARDGYDNTGTQGKDSLSDDAYNNKAKNKGHRTEDDALNTGI